MRCHQGILIEPNVRNFELLRVNRPEAAAVNAAICNVSSTVHFAERDAVGGIIEFMADWQGPAPGQDTDWLADAQPVQCIPLKSILTRLGATHINFWTLDVEVLVFRCRRAIFPWNLCHIL